MRDSSGECNLQKVHGISQRLVTKRRGKGGERGKVHGTRRESWASILPFSEERFQEHHENRWLFYVFLFSLIFEISMLDVPSPIRWSPAVIVGVGEEEINIYRAMYVCMHVCMNAGDA